jgi:hypothetical protein
MNTLPPAMAAEDLTGPPVLKDHSSFNPSGSGDDATPANAGPPRNIGHESAGQAVRAAGNKSQTMQCAAFISRSLRGRTMHHATRFGKLNNTYTYNSE